MIHTVKGFGVINKADIDFFLKLSCFFYDPVDFGNFISGSSAFSKSSLNIWKFTVHVLLKPGLDFEHYFASMWDECKRVVVWTFFGIAFLWDWNENWPFPVLWELFFFLVSWPQSYLCGDLFLILFRLSHFQSRISCCPVTISTEKIS